jgi:large subunit ribosomal protein L10
LKREEKERQVAWLREEFNSQKCLVLSSYQGLTVAETDKLRRDLRAGGAKYKVLKNTLARLAYRDTDVSLLEHELVGPRAAAWTYDEDKAPALAKTLLDFAKGHANMQVLAGVVSGSVLTAPDIEALSKLPGKAEMRATLLGTMNAPIGSFVNTLAAVPRSLLNCLKAIEEKKAQSESTAPRPDGSAEEPPGQGETVS